MISGLGSSLASAGARSIELAPLQPPTSGNTSGAGFSAALQNVVASAAATLRQGEAAAIGGIQGAVPVQQVVEQVLAAERTLQAAIAIRDKLTGAYLEINRMQI